MGARKNPKTDLKSKYFLNIEIGMTVVLGLLILLLQLDFEKSNDFEVTLEEQEVVEMEEVQQTKQEVKPPPPPRPPVPVEVPNDEVIEDEALDLDASLDLDEELSTDQGPPPPPPNEEEAEGENEIFVVVEEKPKLIGGMDGLYEKIEYPEFAQKAGIEGRVIVQFVVNKDGTPTNIEVLRSPHKLLREEAIRVIRESKFEPGKQRGNPVRVKMSLPITFRLRN